MWAVVDTRYVRFLKSDQEQEACLERGMNCYPMAAGERTMKIQEVILQALACLAVVVPEFRFLSAASLSSWQNRPPARMDSL
jgi:hypothetical protein